VHRQAEGSVRQINGNRDEVDRAAGIFVDRFCNDVSSETADAELFSKLPNDARLNRFSFLKLSAWEFPKSGEVLAGCAPRD